MSGSTGSRSVARLLVAIQVFLLVASLFAPVATLAADPSPDPSAAPSAEPSAEPTRGTDRGAHGSTHARADSGTDRHPTPEATAEPTAEPTPEPTVEPTPEPSVEPSPEPTAEPTPEPTAPAATNPYVVSFVAGTASAEQTAAVIAAGATTTDTIGVLRIHAVNASDAAVALLRADPLVATAELDRSRAVEAAPSDPNYGDQWALPKIGWDQAFGVVDPAGSAVVAVLDTGVDASHPDLDGNIVTGTSFVAGSSWSTDSNGHGTAMAGIVAAETDNGAGIAGVGYAGVKVMPVTVLGADGLGRDSDIIEGVVWAADHGADVILMSFSRDRLLVCPAGRDRLRLVQGRRPRGRRRQRRLRRPRPSRPAIAASSASRTLTPPTPWPARPTTARRSSSAPPASAS